MALLTRAELQSEIATSIDNDVLDRWIAEASERVRDLCEQPLLRADDGQSNVELRFRGDQRTTFVHGYHPAELVRLEVWEGGWTEAAWDVEACEIDGAPVLWASQSFSPYSRYRALLNVGYATAPAVVQKVALEMCLIRYAESDLGGKRLGVASIGKADASFGSVTTTYKELEERWRADLRAYRRREC